jgi:two-component sensor histidine kinase
VRPSLKRPGWLVLAGERHINPRHLFWILQVSGWGLLAVGAFAHEIIVTQQYWYALANAFALIASGVPVSVPWHTALGYAKQKRITPAHFIFVICCGSIAAGLLWSAFNCIVLALLRPGSVSWAFQLPETLDLVGVRAALIFIWGVLYLAIKQWIELELAGERMVRAELATQTARLSALQSQLQPHFIFNSLNAISTLVGDGLASEARSALSLLGDFLRRTMQMRDTPEITVAAELEFVRQYLDLVELRFGDRLRSRIDVHPSALSSSIPCLLLQPLVENAVRHGLAPRNMVGTIDIRIAATESALFLTVEDDGVGLKRKPADVTGIGLSNVATRLSDLYGAAAKITVGSSGSGGVCVAIRLPRRRAQTTDHIAVPV